MTIGASGGKLGGGGGRDGGGRLGMGTVGGGGEGGEGGTGGGDDGGGEGRVGAFTTKSTSQAGTTSHSPGEPMTWTVTRWAP